MKTTWVLCLICCILCISGCSQRLGDFTVLSTKNVDLSNFSTQTETGTDRVKGEDVSHIIIIFPNKIPNLKEAIDVAIEENNSYMLSEAVIKYEYFIVPYIYGQTKYVVEGHPVRRSN